MHNYSKFKRSALSLVLVIAMLLSNFSVGLTLGVAADPQKSNSKTDGEIVAENYSQLGETEKKLISSGLLIGSTHNYSVPDANNDLISVDTDNKTVTAKTYEGTNGYLWTPVSADITVSDDVKETINFTDGKATYTYAGDAFAVKVKYELKLSVDENTQSELLNASFYLKQAMDVMETIADAREKLSTMEVADVVSILKDMNSAGGYGIVMDTPFGQVNGSLSFQNKIVGDAKYKEKDAATALLAQMDANAGNKLDISVIADEYAVAESKVAYIVEKADKIRAAIIDTYDYLYAITRDGCALVTAATYIPDTNPLRNVLVAFVNGLKDAASYLNTADTNASALQSVRAVVKSGLTTTQYKALDTLVNALAGVDGMNVIVKNPLVVDTATVQFNMAMYDVTTKVVLKLTSDAVGSADVVAYDTKTNTVTLAEGATKAEIEAAVAKSNVVSESLAAWTGKYVEDKFNVTYSELPATLTKDVEYVITYSPKLFSYKYLDEAAKNVPYGYKVALPMHSDSLKAYDYDVNGNYFAQGSVYTVVSETTITRAEGKAYKNYTVNGLVSDIYFKNNDKAQAILASGALNIGNDVISVRVPDNSNGIVKLTGTTLKADNYPSSYKGLAWVPYTYTVVNGTTETKYDFNGQNSVTIVESEFDRVDVVYTLKLTDISTNYVLEVAKLPNILVNEAKEQTKILDTLAKNTGAMSQVNKGLLNGIKGVVDGDPTISADVKTKLLAAINGIANECLDASGNLTIYNMMLQYKDANNGGLRYYYLNSASIIEAINSLTKYLNQLLGDGTDTELKDALVSLLVSSGMSQYVDKIDQLDELKGYMNEAAQIAPPNRVINLEDKTALGKLADALTMAGTVSDVTKVDSLYINATAISVNADNKVTITASVSKPGSAAVSITPLTFNKGYVLKQQDVNKILEELNAAIKTLNVDGKYYTTDYDANLINNLVGKDVSVLTQTAFEFTWTPKTFTVSVEGVDADQTVSVDNLEISLPAGTAALRYEYVIDGNKYPAGTYKFTLEQLDKLFVNGKYNITRVVTDVSKSELIEFVNSLNKAIGNNGIVFALTEKGAGEYAIVMKINAADINALPTALKGMAMELAQSYTYIAFDDNALVYDDNGTKISIQAIINTIMESSFGTEAIKKLVDANGNILNIALPGTVISDKAMTVAGGKLAQTSLVLGSSANATDYNIPLYITLGSAPSYLTQLRNLLANQLAPYFNFTFENGKINVGLNLPQKAYEAYLAVLLVADYADIADVNSINEDVALGFLMDIIHPLMSSDASASSVQNTLAKFGYNINLTNYNEAFEVLRNLYKNTTFSYNTEDSTYDIDSNVGIKGLISSLNIDSFANLIAEKDTGLNFSIAVNLENLDKKYEALYFDIGAAGITNKFGLVEDVAAKLNSIAGTAVVILLDDVNANLTFNTTTVLNLNGKTVNGKITSNKSLRIIDTIIDAGVVGSVSGTISGNVKIAGGKYAKDVSAFLTEGYTQGADGVVKNDFFTLVKEDDGSISVKLNAGMLATNKIPDITTLAVDVVAEILVNGFTANKLYVNDLKVYEITVDDLIGIYTASSTRELVIDAIMDMISVSDLKVLANEILADLTDFDSLSAILNADIANNTESPLLSYKVTTGVWGISVDYVESDDSITTSLVSNKTKDRDLNIIITGSAEDKKHFANLVGILADTTDADLKIDTVAANKVTGGFNFNLGVSGKLNFDFTSDHKYAVMLNVLLADGLGAPANSGLVAGLKTFFETGEMQELADAFNKLTIAQVVTAIKNLQRSDSFAAMLTNLGLDGYDVEDAKALEAEVGAFAKLFAILVRRLNVNGTSTTLGSFIDATTNAYTIDKNNIKRAISATVGGYAFTFNAELVEGFVSLKLFGEKVVLVDYTELQNQINIATGLVKDNYSTKTWNALEAALAVANDALNSKDQAVVDKAAEDLKAAIAALADITALKATIAGTAGLVKDNYSTKTWNAFEAALAVANDALVNGDIAGVTKADEDLKKAKEALADITALKALIASTSNLKEDDYTSKTWVAFASALNVANDALVNGDKAAVATAEANLKAAIAGLKKKPVPTVIDYEELKAQIAAAQAITDSSKYTKKTWDALQTALTAGKKMLTSTSQSKVNAAALAIKTAIEALADITELNAKLQEALAITDSSKYTKKTWDALQAAITAANGVLTDGDKAAVAAAVASLTDAIAKLADVTALREQLAIAAGKVEADYTADSWAALKTAVANGEDALVNGDIATVAAAVEALKKAISELKTKPTEPTVDYSELQALIAQAEALKEAEYTAATWANLVSALNAAKEALNSKEQTVVDAAAAALKAAIEALEKKPGTPAINYEELKAQIAAAEALNAADYTKETWAALETALEAARAALNSTSQAEVDAAAAALKAAIEALEEKAPIWPWILIAVLVLLVIAAVVILIIVKKKKKTTDNTPLVDYDIADDN